MNIRMKNDPITISAANTPWLMCSLSDGLRFPAGF